MITEDYVSFEVAKLLKDKGFDWHTYAYYEDEDNPNIIFHAGKAINWNKTEFFSKPTLQMAMKWLREQNRIISIVHGYITNKYRIIITQSNELDITNLGNTLYCSNDYDYFSYEEACEAAIKYCLEKLI